VVRRAAGAADTADTAVAQRFGSGATFALCARLRHALGALDS
jgi:hypothetical protein